MLGVLSQRVKAEFEAQVDDKYLWWKPKGDGNFTEFETRSQLKISSQANTASYLPDTAKSVQSMGQKDSAIVNVSYETPTDP